MNGEWQWKLGEAINRIQERYAYVGSKTGASLLGIVYPPAAEPAVYREWDAQTARLGADYDIQTVDVLAITVQTVADLGSDHVVASIIEPMPGSNPEAELGHMWIDNVTRKIYECFDNSKAKWPVIALHNVAALYPATTTRALMQAIWDNTDPVPGPVIVFIPGTLVEARVYKFLDKENELMYRGDII